MLIDIYKSMLETVETQKVPRYITLKFYIGAKQSEEFWSNKENGDEQLILLDEWDGNGRSEYTKRFHGVNFAIVFEHLV